MDTAGTGSDPVDGFSSFPHSSLNRVTRWEDNIKRKVRWRKLAHDL